MPVTDAAEVRNDGEMALLLGDRRYRVRGWKKPLNPDSLKVNLLVHRPADPEGRFQIDPLDLTEENARAAFVKADGLQLCEAADVLNHVTCRLLLKPALFPKDKHAP